MTRFLNGPVLNLLLVAGIGLSIYYAATLTERAGVQGPSGRLLPAATPPAIRKDAGSARSVNVEVAYHRGYPVNWRRRYHAEHAHVQRLLHQLHVRQPQAHETAQEIIRRVFGAHGDEAVRVADCETGGTFSPGATNGQYRGIFQMGSRERATYGDAGDVEGQARAAYRYFAVAGWGPWECKP